MTVIKRESTNREPEWNPDKVRAEAERINNSSYGRTTGYAQAWLDLKDGHLIYGDEANKRSEDGTLFDPEGNPLYISVPCVFDPSDSDG